MVVQHTGKLVDSQKDDDGAKLFHFSLPIDIYVAEILARITPAGF